MQHKVVELEDGRFLLKFVPKNHGLYQFEVDVCTNGNDKFAPVKGSPSELELYLTIGIIPFIFHYTFLLLLSFSMSLFLTLCLQMTKGI